MTWTPQLLDIFDNLKSAITLSPLLVRYNSTKPIFLKTDWSSTGTEYILMQPDDSKGFVAAGKQSVYGAIDVWMYVQSADEVSRFLEN